MANRAFRILGGSFVGGAVGAALPLAKLITLRTRNKVLDRSVTLCQQDAENYKRDLEYALQTIRTMENELEEHKRQKNEDEETISGLRNENKELRHSLTTAEHNLQPSFANEKQQQKTIAELLQRQQKPSSAPSNVEQSAHEEHARPNTDTVNHDQEACADGSKGLEKADSQSQSMAGIEHGPAGKPEDPHQSERRLHPKDSLEESISLRVSSCETLDPDIYLTQMPMKTCRRRKRTQIKESAKAARHKNHSIEPPSESVTHGDFSRSGRLLHTRRNSARNGKRLSLRERLDSELQEYFANETIHRRSW